MNADPELERSIGIALSPWGVDVVPYRTEPAPGASLPQAAYRAREIALDLGTNGVVWVSAGRDDAVLWIYDADLNHIGSRVMTTPPPFDEATSAAVALSVKTLLRTSTVAPEAERFGAKPPPPPATLRVEAAVGARASAPSITPRVGIGLAYWPSLLKERIGIAVTTTGGPGVGITSSSFAARFNDWTLSPALRLRFAAGRHAAIAGAARRGACISPRSTARLCKDPRPFKKGASTRRSTRECELDWRFGHVLDFRGRRRDGVLLALPALPRRAVHRARPLGRSPASSRSGRSVRGYFSNPTMKAWTLLVMSCLARGAACGREDVQLLGPGL